MEKLTNQEIFNKVATHLIKQNKKAMKRGVCKYQTEDGLQCAVGCLIAKEDYIPSIEGLALYQDKFQHNFNTLLRDIDYSTSYILLKDLQDIHDNRSVCSWKRNLINLGKEYYLDLPECLSESLGE